MNCPNPRCAKVNPDGAKFCCACGHLLATKKGRRTRANGMGTAYKRGRTWVSSITTGWKDKDGQPVPIKRTKGGFATKRDALDYCAILKTEKARNKTLTFAQLYTVWEASHAHKISMKTLGGYRAARKFYASIDFIHFSDISLDDLQDCIDECARGRRTKENMKSLVSMLYKYALPRHMADMDYAKFLDTGDDLKGVRNALTAEHTAMIRNSIGIIPYADYAYCLIYTGFRPNEMLSLTIDSFNESEGTLTGGFKTEAGIDRPIPVSPKIMPIIMRLVQRAKRFIFPRPDGTLMRDDYFRENCFYPLLNKLNIQPIPQKGARAKYTPYGCRHAFANLLKDVHGSDTDKAALMGHASPEMTKYYQSADITALREIMNNV